MFIEKVKPKLNNHKNFDVWLRYPYTNTTFKIQSIFNNCFNEILSNLVTIISQFLESLSFFSINIPYLVF